MKLVSFGDEYTLGPVPYCELLADKIGIDCVNVGDLDVSNDRIYKKVIKYTCENPGNHNILMIGWTDPFRFDIEFDDKLFTLRKDRDEYDVTLVKKILKFREVLFNETLCMENWATLAFSLQEYLKSINQKYYMFNTQSKISYSEHTNKTIRNLDARFYHNPINLESSMIHFLKKQGYKIDTIEANKAWARFLFAKMKAVGVID